MSEEVKGAVGSSLEVKANKEVERFQIEILGEKGEKFYFSGPAASEQLDREKVIYTLFSHYSFHRIQQEFIKKAKAAEATKAKEASSKKVELTAKK